MTGLRELTAEQKAKPYSKYYYRGNLRTLLPEIYAEMGGVVA